MFVQFGDKLRELLKGCVWVVTLKTIFFFKQFEFYLTYRTQFAHKTLTLNF